MKIKKSHLYEKGQAVFYEGNSCEGVYLLRSGSIKLMQSSLKGDQHTLEIILPGDLIEKSAVFCEGPHTVSAQALERSEVCLFHPEDFFELLKSHAHLALSLILVLTKEVERGRERIRRLLFESAKKRLACILVDLSHHHGARQSEGVAINLGLKRHELAEMVGVTLETTVRLLTKMKNEKLIRLNGKQIVVLDEEGLRQVSA
ncbi:MAG: Crp/Fnr family transcriptional regulator [Nitrospiria bacterium]